ncbi:xanthine dehydrogenase family protein molybdopterin-binding subunit [Xanthobacter pseudotagetidis]|uniref:xanthine dehydrogenase family protein molybdopterin-binding subunit n=1 Tax=Xanthobacter pseudotagetidis TaxID=3119911 RepID=UPI00372C9685
MKFGIGQSVKRTEDAPLVTGRGRYVADLAARAETLAALVLRAPHANARFTLAGVDEARAMPGVRLVLTGADVAGLGPLPVVGTIRVEGEPRMWTPARPVLCADRVRHVGDPVAFIVADALDMARDAAEAIQIRWEPEPAVADLAAALADGAPRVWEERAGNIAFSAAVGDARAVEAAFAAAARVVKLDLVNNRLVTNYMETRGVLAEVEDSGRVRLTLGSQGSHGLRDAVAKILGWAREELRVITPDVGGGFGTKAFPFSEYPLAALAARRLGRPVAWIGDRTEHFLADSQGRDNLTTAELALDADGRFLALKVDTLANMGAYLGYYAPFIPWVGATMLPGVYDIPAVHARIRGVLTHTAPVDAYRGAGRPEAAYVIERLVDEAARETGIGPVELRRRNFVTPGQMPYLTATGRTYDSGVFDRHMTRALALSGWEAFPERAAAAAGQGLARGIGLATYIEACGGGSPEPAYLSLDADGGVTVKIGTQSNGQGHRTAYAQLVAAELQLPLERVRVLQGDTDDTPTGNGTGGSRSIPVGGAAVDGAARALGDKLRTLAADALEADAGDIAFRDGRAVIAGTDRGLDLAAIAALPDATPDLLTATHAFKPSEATYPNGTHVCEVEIDPETGATRIVAYTVVDDFGATLNPMLLEGQIHGGVAQGIGQALAERTLYDPDGQLLTASFMDYALPRAADLPPIVFETANVPCATNPLGVKGAGEAGTIGACPAVMNAMVDALTRAGRPPRLDMPALPQAVAAAFKVRD